MDHVLPEAVSYVLEVCGVLDGIEAQIFDANRRLKAQQLGELKLRNSNEEPTENDLLREELYYWAKILSDELAAPLNPFSERYRGRGGAAGSTPVSHPAR